MGAAGLVSGMDIALKAIPVLTMKAALSASSMNLALKAALLASGMNMTLLATLFVVGLGMTLRTASLVSYGHEARDYFFCLWHEPVVGECPQTGRLPMSKDVMLNDLDVEMSMVSEVALLTSGMSMAIKVVLLPSGKSMALVVATLASISGCSVEAVPSSSVGFFVVSQDNKNCTYSFIQYLGLGYIRLAQLFWYLNRIESLLRSSYVTLKSHTHTWLRCSKILDLLIGQ